MMADRQAVRSLRVALYARVSTRDKDQDPELQLEVMREYVRALPPAWPRVQVDLAAGQLSRRQAARRLGIGTATLARLLTADGGTGGGTDG